MKRFTNFWLFLLSMFSIMAGSKEYDLTIVGFHRFAWGIGRRPIAFIDMLKDDLRINYKVTRSKPCSNEDIDRSIQAVLDRTDPVAGTVAFFVDILSYKEQELYTLVPDSKIKLAFVTIEMTRTPAEWVYALNNYFDGVIVPDPWLIHVLSSSGVKIPIFMIPEPCYLQEFLALPAHRQSGPFVFGISAQATKNKNYVLLLEAFAEEFGNDDRVLLSIHNTLRNTDDELKRAVARLGLSNVQIQSGELSWEEYKAYMYSIDCYVLISKGEGYSITPREALACGTPCILSNNTAHRTLCDSGFVRPVISEIPVAHNGEHYNEAVGHSYLCERSEVQKALREVYTSYDEYGEKARIARSWVAQYEVFNLKQRYLSLFKPRTVLLGKKNEVTNEYLMTNSPNLFCKYQEIR